ncbi:MAG TPA: gamma-glutamyl-gamma-aminobutyrate hydrolase family protein, partial [Acidimicrobiales bacterium]|nr:gamma-glutamyl-gamma-aminobutyrate hydrolase family protein [Acidimicrobiales bacterium]
RPLIGVTTYRQVSSWWAWERDAALVPAPYIDHVARAGGWPLLIPPCDPGNDGPGAGAAKTLAVLDGLVLIGGGDVDAARYGRPPDPRNGGVSDLRDASELAVLAEALRTDLPVLAVCRGAQLLNVHLGGDLVQYLPDVTGTTIHQPAPGAFGDVGVTTERGSRVNGVVGDRVQVPCSHHQSIGTVGRGLVVTARADDGVVEAVELSDHRFVVGVQWHPEERGGLRLFEALVEASMESPMETPMEASGSASGSALGSRGRR